jgi:hypothetical protein
LLLTGSKNFKQNKSLAFIMYFTGYRMGLIDLEEKIVNLRKELLEEGEPFAELITDFD